MKAFASVLFLCAAFSVLTPTASAQEYYSKRYDSLDVNLIFRSSRLLNNYVDCLLDKKPCPPEGKDLKRVLPDALRTRCSQCTRVQKEKALDVITRLYYEFPAVYTALAVRYDPTGEYTRNFESWFDEQNAVKPRPLTPQEREEEPNNVKINRQSTEIPTDSSTQQAVRRSPDLNVRANPNELPTERTRISTSWVTASSSTTTQRATTTRAPLRTSAPTRPALKRNPPVTTQAPANQRPTQTQPNFQIDNIFAPRPNGPITRSINKLLDTTEKVVNGFAGMFRSTLEIITGTG